MEAMVSTFVFPIVQHPRALVVFLGAVVGLVWVEFHKPSLLFPSHPTHRQVRIIVGFGFEFGVGFGFEVDLMNVDQEKQQSLKTFAK